MYKRCSRFKSGTDRQLCEVLGKLGSFLHEKGGLGLRDYIDGKFKDLTDFRNLNNEYQDILKVLYEMGVGSSDYRKIAKTKDGYYTSKLENKGMVEDEEGNWLPINKLNTNHFDLAELVVEVFIRNGKSAEMMEFYVEKGPKRFKKALLNQKGDLHRILNTYFPEIDEFHDFTNNIKHTSSTGDATENYVKTILEKKGFKTIFQGGDGDFIDMIYGIDLIMEWKGKNYTIQVKNNPNQLEGLTSKPYYKFINLFISKREGYLDGIKILRRSGIESVLDGEGQEVTDSKDDKTQTKET